MNLEQYERHTYTTYSEYISTYGDIYEFGVYGGKSLEILLHNLKVNNIPYRNVYGFDSFVELPEEETGVQIVPDWAPGSFNACKLYNASIEETKNFIRKRTNYIPYLIDGFFKDTLNEETIKKYDMKKASFINIDCDLYVSTCEILEFIYSNNLFQIGTIIRYDDFNVPHYMGEPRAHREIGDKYGLRWKTVANQFHMKQIVGQDETYRNNK